MPTSSSPLVLLLLVPICLGEIFTNPFHLRAAFLAEGRIVQRMLKLGIGEETSVGKNIAE
jgi:hypothetical protein